MTKRVPVLVTEGEKYCFRCENVKPLSDFYVSQRFREGGRQPECKTCRLNRAAMHRATRRAANAAYARQYRRDNPGLWRGIRARNPEKWSAEMVAGNQRARARKRNAPGSGVSRQQWAEMKVEYGGRCAYCAEVKKLTMDHVVPLSKGGAHDVSNVVPACRECNSGKCDRNILQWLAARAAA